MSRTFHVFLFFGNFLLLTRKRRWSAVQNSSTSFPLIWDNLVNSITQHKFTTVPIIKPLSYISNNRFMNRVELWNKFGHEPSRPMTRFKPQVESNHNASWILQAGFLINLLLRLCYLNPCALVPFCLCLCVCISVRWAVMEKSRLASYIFNEIFKYKV